MAEHGLVDNLGRGVYRITREGRLYLVGGYDAESKEILQKEEKDENLVDQYIQGIKNSAFSTI